MRKLAYFLSILTVTASCGSESIETNEDWVVDTLTSPYTSEIDTIRSGVELPCQMSVVDMDTMPAPVEYTFDEIEEFSAHENLVDLMDPLVYAFKDSISGSIKDSVVKAQSAKGERIICKVSPPVPAQSSKFMESATYDIQIIDADEGLNSTYLWSIIEDSRGDIWFASHDAGVARFNGQDFTYYTTESGLCDNSIRAVYEDSKGNLWFASKGSGVSVFDGEYFENFDNSGGLINEMITTIFEDSEGNIWLGTNGSGVIKYDGINFTNYDTRHGLSHLIIRSICEDDDGNLWFGSWGGGITIFDGQTFSIVNNEQGKSNGYIRALFKDSKGNIWIGKAYGNGLQVFDGENFTRIREDNGLLQNSVTSFAETPNGDMWIGTDGGISRFTGTQFEHFTDSEGLSANAVRSLIVDSKGTVWAGTWGGGAQHIKYPSFKHYTKNNGLVYDHVSSITKDSKDNFWLGSYPKGLMHFDGDKFTSMSTSQKYYINGVMCTYVDDEDNVWFGSIQGGLNKYDGTKITNIMPQQGLSALGVFIIKPDANGDLWMGMNGGGICKYDGKKISRLTEDEGLSDNIVRDFEIDKNGTVWIGTWSMGLCKFDGEKITHITPKEGLSSKQVYTMEIDSYGDLWVGTDMGIDKLDPTKPIFPEEDNFIHINKSNGLSNNNVLGIVQDKENDLWVSTRKGLNRIIISDSAYSQNRNETPEIRTYLKEDGLISTDFFVNSLYVDDQDVLWAGTGKSLMKYELSEARLEFESPKAVLTRLSIGDSFIDYRQLQESEQAYAKFESVATFYNYPEGLALPHDHNHLTFHFSGSDWSASHKTEFSYLLEGSGQDDWSTPSKKPFADYRNLIPGEYTFKLKARSLTKEWGESFSYEFTIHPPWWETWWAKILYGLIILFSVIAVVRWRTNKLKKRQVQLESEIDKATQEIRSQKDEVEKQKDVIEEAHKEITDSIAYAKRIQTAILPPRKLVKEYLNDSFILYKPKDVVAGDFYWMQHKNDMILFAAADCTGHGVPGAMVSVICNNGLNRSVREYGLTDPGEILDKTRDIVISEFEKSEDEVMDGMDIALCSLKGMEFQYAGANNPLWLIRNGELLETKADKQPIGMFSANKNFTTHKLQLLKGDTIYIFSDGYADQFGGERGKKFKTKAFKELLLSIQDHTMDEQLEILDQEFETWRGSIEQIDDVCVIGARF